MTDVISCTDVFQFFTSYMLANKICRIQSSRWYQVERTLRDDKVKLNAVHLTAGPLSSNHLSSISQSESAQPVLPKSHLAKASFLLSDAMFDEQSLGSFTSDEIRGPVGPAAAAAIATSLYGSGKRVWASRSLFSINFLLLMYHFNL